MAEDILPGAGLVPALLGHVGEQAVGAFGRAGQVAGLFFLNKQ